MTGKDIRQAATALALAATLAGIGAAGAMAQEYLGSEVTVGGDAAGVGFGDVAVLAPGVTISGGNVVNETGIGVVSGGGSSIGASTGGNESAAVVE